MNFVWKSENVIIGCRIIMIGKTFNIMWVNNLDYSEAFGICREDKYLVFIIGKSKEEAAEYLNKYEAVPY